MKPIENEEYWVLTKTEQKEILQYIRDRLAGNPIDVGKLPIWLADLERIRQESSKKEDKL
jgi:hypothetical protein